MAASTDDIEAVTIAGMAKRRERMAPAGVYISPDPVADYRLVCARLGTLEQHDTEVGQRLAALEQRPQTPPVPEPPAPSRYFVVAAWVPLALSLLLIAATQAATALRALPPSQPLAIALVVLTVITSSIPLMLQAIAQYQAQQHAHAERMAGIVRQ